jgi:DNA helicase-2/ATP-dependent DNA helicase PcrA
MHESESAGLNPEQKIAIQHAEGPLLVLAGAGSGKTRVVTQRIVQLIRQGIHPSQIVAVTFTNKAAKEMKERVAKLAGAPVLISTFHSLGVRILREFIHHLEGYSEGFTIYDEEDSLKLIRMCVESLGVKEKGSQAKTLKGLISNAKNQLLAPDEINRRTLFTDAELIFPQVYEKYQQRLKECNALDFDDLLCLAVRLLLTNSSVLQILNNRWHYILIDEYQDTNQAQYEMARLLAGERKNLFVVGDPDQSIYSWRGANIHNILNFPKDFPGAKVVKLEQNYRSTNTILKAANAVISKNSFRHEKSLWSALGEGDLIINKTTDDERDEASYIVSQMLKHRSKGLALNQMVVFYRTNFQSRVLEDALLQEGIPYTIVGGISFYQRKEIKDVLAFLKIVHCPTDFISFERTINLPKRGIGKASLDKIEQAANDQGIPLIEAAKLLSEGKEVGGIKLTGKSKSGLADFIRVRDLLVHTHSSAGLAALVEQAIRGTGYLDSLKEDRDTYEDRRDNVFELYAKAEQWEKEAENRSLAGFLEELALKSNLDEMADESERVSLMTVHNGKGLEFPVVFLCGAEEDLFPHVNSKDDPNQIEEERRLFYVGMTRAKQHLYITNARRRFLWGVSRRMNPSRFLREIPANMMTKNSSSSWSQLDDDEEVDSASPIPESSFRVIKDAEHEIEPDPIASFAKDDLVIHPAFGIGTIQRVYNGSLGITYEIFFQNENRSRTIVGAMSPLKKL